MSKVILKTGEQIEMIRQSADLLSRTLGELAKKIQPGVKTIELDKLAYEYIHDHGASPAFLNYNGFPFSIFISVNVLIVIGFHGVHVLNIDVINIVVCGVNVQ